jgi:predicted peroxiredoxin
MRQDNVEDTIENGVKQVKSDKGYMNHFKQIYRAERTIENGVKHTMWSNDDDDVKDTIKNGVRYTKERKVHFKYLVEDAVQNGVKDIGARHLRINRKVDDAIENGVKEVKTPGNGDLVSTVEWMDENNTYNVPELIDDVIENGVKEIKHKMAESYQQKDHMVTNSIITEDINYAIENGVKE